MSWDVAPAILARVRAESAIDDALGTYQQAKAYFTKRPLPAGDPGIYPACLIPKPIVMGNADALASFRPIVTRQVCFYGLQDKHFRVVDDLGYIVHRIFHRRRDALVVDGFQTIEIECSGPVEAPVSNEKLVGSVVILTIQLREI